MEQFVWETAEELDQKLAQRVRNIRKRRSISQEKLSSMSGVSYGSIKRFETTGQISLIAAFFLFSLELPGLPAFFGFLCSLICSVIVSFFMNFILGLLSMVTMNIRNINWGYNALLRFFSGQMVPLWIFPSVLGVISDFLPFRCIYAIPMSIYIGNYAGMDILGALTVQFTWIFVLWLTSRLLMKRVFTRVMIQGG